MELQQFLIHLTTSQGIGITSGVIISIISEYWQPFNNLPTNYKRPMILLICAMIALLSVSTQVIFGYVAFEGFVPLIEGLIWPALMQAVTAFTTSQITHQVIDK